MTRPLNSLCFSLALAASFLIIAGFIPSPIWAMGTFTSTGNMTTGRTNATITKLQNGKILIAGGFTSVYRGSSVLNTAEIFDPITGTFRLTGTMNLARYNHTATLLPSGKVLITGGGINVKSTELFDPDTEQFIVAPDMMSSRTSHKAILLNNGKVLITGGAVQYYSLSSAELYDPQSNSFTSISNMTVDRRDHTMTLLNNGDVLIAAGFSDTTSPNVLSSAEIYNPISNQFMVTGNMSNHRFWHESVKLLSGKVLIVGGQNENAIEISAIEEFNPTTGAFSTVGKLLQARGARPAVVLLPSGKILIVGGATVLSPNGIFNALSTAELYDPLTNTILSTGSMKDGRVWPMSVLLNDGTVLVAGGHTGGNVATALATAEIYTTTGGGSFSSVQLPQTGQTKCYNSGGTEIPCAGTGQDGELQAGVAWPNPRFSNNNNGTVTDNLTGLIWLKNANCKGAQSWANALNIANSLADGQCDLSDGSTAGMWRLPNINEMKSLISIVNTGPSLQEGHPFQNVNAYNNQAAYYWSSTTFANLANDAADAWFVDLWSGGSGNWSKSGLLSVWLVRNGQSTSSVINLSKTGQTISFAPGDDGSLGYGTTLPVPRFAENENYMVTDNISGLVWAKDAGTPTVGTCDGGLKNWHNALSYVSCLNNNKYLGFSDWRLPNFNELLSLKDYSKPNFVSWISGNGFINVLPGNEVGNFWSSSSGAYTNAYARLFYTRYGGNISYNDKSNSYNVWPVRGGKSGSRDFTQLQLQATPASGTIPLTVSYSATSSKPASGFMWDFGDGTLIQTISGNISHVYTTPGQFTAIVTTNNFAGSAQTTVAIADSPYISGPFSFVPFYPESNSTASTVMSGGIVSRWYRLLDSQGAPLIKKTFKFRDSRSLTIRTASTDDAGFVAIEVGPFTGNFVLDMEILNEDLSVNTDAQNIPSFNITVTEREFAQEWSLLLGYDATVGIGGLGIKIGPVKFKSIEAAIGMGNKGKISVIFDRDGKNDNVTLTSSIINELSGSGSFGLFSKFWNSNASLGVETEATYSKSRGIVVKFGRFFDKSKSDYHTQTLTAAGLFLETILRSLPTMPFGADRVMSWIIDEIDRGSDISQYKYSEISEVTTDLKSSIDAKIILKNPLGFPGSSINLDVAKAEFERINTLSFEQLATGVRRDTLETTSAGSLSFLSVSLEQKFSGNKRKKNTPNLVVNNSYNLPVLDQEITTSITASHDQQGNLDVVFLRRTTDATSNDYGFLSTVTEKNSVIAITNQHNLNNLQTASPIINNMKNMSGINLFTGYHDKTINDVLSYVSGIEEIYSERQDKKIFNFDFDVEISAGLKLGFGIVIQGMETRSFKEKISKFSSDRGVMLTERYNESGIAEQQKKLADFLSVFRDALNAAVNNLVTTVEASVVDGIRNSGAEIKKTVGNFFGSLSKLVTGKSSGSIMALKLSGSRIQTDTTELLAAKALGDVYIVNLKDAEGTVLSDFSENPLTLTIDYSDQLLADAGIDPSNTPKLAIYRWDGSVGCYIYQPSSVDEIAKTVTASITKPGQYLIAIDEVPPTVTDFRVSNGTPTPAITATFKDSFSGLALSTFIFTLDGTTKVDSTNHQSYLDPVSGLFTYIVLEPLYPGNHTATLSVKDTAGNNAIVAPLNFSVNSTPPTIVHTPITTAVSGIDLKIPAIVTDDTGISRVILSYRPELGEFSNVSVDMVKGAGDTYSAAIPKEILTSLNIRYTVKAIDLDGNTTELAAPVIVTVTDTTSPDTPTALKVTVQGGNLLMQWAGTATVDTATYKLFYGNTVATMTSTMDVGLFTSGTISGLDTTKQWYLAISAVDAKGNASPLSTPVLVTFPQRLAIIFAGTGGGSLNSVPTGINCTYPPQAGNCVADFTLNDTVSLLAAPNGDSLVSWTGACSGSSACAPVMSEPRDVTATFTFVKPAKIGDTFYDSLALAYGAASTTGTIIKSRAYSFTGNFVVDKGVTIQGGYNPAFNGQTGFSTIAGKLTIGKGSLVADRVVIR